MELTALNISFLILLLDIVILLPLGIYYHVKNTRQENLYIMWFWIVCICDLIFGFGMASSIGSIDKYSIYVRPKITYEKTSDRIIFKWLQNESDGVNTTKTLTSTETSFYNFDSTKQEFIIKEKYNSYKFLTDQEYIISTKK